MSLATGEQVETEPRRGGRERKTVQKYNPGEGASRKRQADNSDDEGEDEIEGQDPDASDAEEAPRPAKSKKRPSAPGPSKKTTSSTKKPKGKPRTTTTGDSQIQLGTQTIKDDCPLFNALTSPDIALLPLIEEWVENYQQAANDEVSERACVHELVLMFIRCCGLSSDVTEDEAMDTDGVVDALERIQDESVKTIAAIYPLIARTKESRTLKTNLNLFIPHLIKTLSLSPLLYLTADTTEYSTVLISLLLAWLHSMSSSPLRPIRHTSTYLSLKINTALCDVAAGVSSDLSLKQRQKDAEVKKGGQSAAAQKKLKELDAKVRDARQKKERLEEYMQETFDVLFVHRVRDADPAIRMDCLRELGVWVKKYPDMYAATTYLAYFTRGCNDPDNKARLETVKALPSIFNNEAAISRARTVISRLAPRLIEMAIRDVDVNVRVHALSVITEIDKTGILEDDDEEMRQRLVRLVFDHEAKVRKAVGGFVRGLWEQQREGLQAEVGNAKGNQKKRAAGINDADMEKWLGYKAIARLLHETASELDRPSDDPQSSSVTRTTASAQAMTRATAGVEALWDSFEELQDWAELVEYLLQDHSEHDDLWLLSEAEESLMLQILVACIKRGSSDDEDEREEQTKNLMDVLPRLFTKHQADSDRMACLLLIPEQMTLSLYQDMRKGAAYEGLWENVSKQFLQHTDPNLLTAAIKTIIHLSSNTAMSVSNDTKLAELDETVFNSLRDAIDGDDVFSMSMSEDRLATLEAILLRVSLLGRSRDITEVMEDEEGGQSSGWDIICAFAERGEVGYKEEAKLVEYALQILFVHITWLSKKFSTEDAANPSKLSAMINKRDKVKDVLFKLALRERGNATELVRRQAFVSLLNLHMLFSSKPPNALPAAKTCTLMMPDELQHRLGGAFAAAAERYASDLEDNADETDEEGDSQLDKIQQEIAFLQLVSSFVGAIRCAVLEVDHAKEPLAHYGRFGPTYDAIVKKLVDVLRDEGIYNKEADTVRHVAGSALQVSFNAFLDTDAEEPIATISLAKTIASSFIVHGTHFTVLKQIHPSDVCDLHMSSIDYVSRKLAQVAKSSKPGKQAIKERLRQKTGQIVSYFKVLVQLLGPITGRDAIKIRDHMEEEIKSAGAKVGSSKEWEGYRAYEKRLITIASKDPAVKLVPTKKTVETRATQDEGDETESDEADKEPTPTRTIPSKRPRSNASIDIEEEVEQDDPAGDSIADEIGGADGEGEDREDQDLGGSVQLEYEDDEDVANGMEIDVDDFDITVPTSQEARERSVSAEPVAKKRKTAKRY